jgi:hypothetical protein
VLHIISKTTPSPPPLSTMPIVACPGTVEAHQALKSRPWPEHVNLAKNTTPLLTGPGTFGTFVLRASGVNRYILRKVRLNLPLPWHQRQLVFFPECTEHHAHVSSPSAPKTPV